METTTDKKKSMRGGEFLIRETSPSDIFIPEEWSEEHKMIAQTCYDFLETEIVPNLDRMDSMEEGFMQNALDKAGELGLLGISIPEEYGGLGLDFKSSMLAADALGAGHSFSVAYGAHTGIGTLPILYYGNEEQKKKYIPKLATGEWKASYALTEPSAGSDANSGKTKAILTADGKHYVINGQKMWITNAGFAHVFIVFAKIDDDENLSAFIVDGDIDGIQLNPEEKKMGIKGSSTRQVFFNDVKVPVENLLYERGKGFKIALNILNIGRIKLAAGVLGGSKDIINHSIKYANERHQFGRQISKYGAIRFKLAEQAMRTYVLESATYRAAQDIQNAIDRRIDEGMDKGDAILQGIEAFAAECAMMKVFGSEVLDYVADEGVQIYGGMGYSAETRVERAYRDARINRIFEGTNEINRMLTVDLLLKKAMKGELDLMGPAMKVAQELTSIPEFGNGDDGAFAAEKKVVENFKKVVLMVAGSAAQKLIQTLSKEQEILMNIADLAIWTYVSESTLLRTQKIVEMKGEAAAKDQIAMTKLWLYDTADRMNKAAKDAINSFVEGDEKRMMLMGLKRFTKNDGENVKELRQQIAQTLIEEGKFPY
ncbi:acyl-CoA dehydrogenase [Cryomorpha ignava]|uniref:Acyl-CoA dehydrogenase n=1 Tax=Cryomorpha ignava TaxID=101383 RepID=A0A7K3WSK5_9FLAO|nr:acyl-CoA dehydrogenase family protein [Cryomorpha ignava]NEN24508.1 acyl-CoA dehydrogenase [Cryomorpha ignava]